MGCFPVDFQEEKRPPRSELMVIWKGWFETAPCRATLAIPFPALCPRILGTRFTNHGLRVSGPLRTKSGKRPIKVGKRPINEGKRPIKAKVLVGVSVGCVMGCFRATPPWRKTAPLKGPLRGLWFGGHFDQTPGRNSEAQQRYFSCRANPQTLSFLSLVFWNSLVNFKQGISLVICTFSLAFPRF